MDPGVEVARPIGPLGAIPSENAATEMPEPVQDGLVTRPELVLHLRGVRGGTLNVAL